jgi:hypothetical protein
VQGSQDGELKDMSARAGHWNHLLCLADVSKRYIRRIRRPVIWRNAQVSPRGWGEPTKRRNLAHMWSQRAVVDYGLAKRAAITSVRSGHMETRDVCDAHPYLMRAARYLGEPTERACPICERRNVTTVTYVYGEELGRLAGRVKATSDLHKMAREYGEFRVYVVEVCQGCAWNHLAVSFVLGTGDPPNSSR